MRKNAKRLGSQRRLGFLDEEGNYYLRARKDDLLVKGGEKIYSRGNEKRAFPKHPDVVGLP